MGKFTNVVHPVESMIGRDRSNGALAIASYKACWVISAPSRMEA